MAEAIIPSISGQTMCDIINDNLIFVDKIAYPAKMIDTGKARRFLARPGRFGKSLTVSTLETIFLAQKDLFRDVTDGS